MNTTLNELLMLLGEKDVLIFTLNKQIAELKQQLADKSDKPDK